MPRRKRSAHQYVEMNKKRWCKDVSKGSSTVSNMRLHNLPNESCENSGTGDYIIVNFKQISKLFTRVKCPECDEQALKVELGTKFGFAYDLNLTCSCCEGKVCAVKTSDDEKGKTVSDINLRITQAFSFIGKGYTAIEKFCMIMDIQPFSSSTYNKCVQKLHSAGTVASQNIFSEVHSDIKSAYQTHCTGDIIDISVSYDGTWLTRGHSSLIGVGCVIDILTGYVIDFEVMSKVCRHCSVAKKELGESSAEFAVWYNGHKSACDINHSGSSGSMEMEAALVLWKRSSSIGFRYTTLLSDGDCKTFSYLTKKMVYGPNIEIKKEECINHVSKRLGTALRTAVKDCRIRGINLGGKVYGSLKETTIKKLTSYYQKAILRNKGDSEAMKTAIYATLYHSISTDEKPQHSKCPSGTDSWCFYQSAVAEGKKPGSHMLNVGTPIKQDFITRILPIYQRLASSELLERCVNCGTQNANESLHNMIWSKCPKQIFAYKERVKGCVREAVCEYNKGVLRTVKESQKSLGLYVGNTSKKLGVILDCRKKLFRNRRKSAKYQLARKLVKKAMYKRKILTEKKEGITYAAGYF